MLLMLQKEKTLIGGSFLCQFFWCYLIYILFYPMGIFKFPHIYIGLIWFMVFNAIFNYNSVISWRSVLLVEESGKNPLTCCKSVTEYSEKIYIYIWSWLHFDSKGRSVNHFKVVCLKTNVELAVIVKLYKFYGKENCVHTKG